MKFQTVGKLMIAIGVAVLLYALNMPVSIGHSDVINFHLMNERQNTLIIGGLLFIAGIVLFATFKLKQTKDEADAESAEFSRKQRLLKEKIENASKLFQAYVRQASKSFQAYVRQVLTVKRVVIAAVVLAGGTAGIQAYEEADRLRARAEDEVRSRNGLAEWQRLEAKMLEIDKIDAAKRLAEGKQ